MEVLRGRGETKNGHNELSLVKHMHALACTKQGRGELGELGCQVLEQHRGSRPPHPRGSGGGTKEQGQTRSRSAARREAHSQLLTSQSLWARLAQRLPPAAAQGEPGAAALGAQSSIPQQPHTQEWDLLLRTPSRPGAFPHLHDSSTSHMEETQGEGWIKQET